MEVAEILKYTLPALIVFLTAFFLIGGYIKAENRKTNLQYIIKNKEITTPLRLQAYERMILFLERISPDALLVRCNKQGITSKEFQSILLSTIRQEFEHNLSQQVYISIKSWEYVKNARSSVVKLINSCASKIEPSSPSIMLSQAVLERVMNDQKESPVSKAINILKLEIQKLF